MNKIILTGRLTRDPEIRYSQGENQTAIGHFSIAVSRRFKREGQPDADFFNCIIFGQRAEFLEKYFTKGMKAEIVGSIQNNNYTNKNGEKVYSVQIVVEELDFGESKSAAAAASSPQDMPQNMPQDSPSGFINIDSGIEDELPF